MINRQEILKKIKNVLRSRSKIRNLEPTILELSDEELNYLKELPQLKRNSRYTYELGEIDGRPSLKMKDNFLDHVMGLEDSLVVHLVPNSNSLADDYNTKWILDVVKMLNDYQDIQQMFKNK